MNNALNDTWTKRLLLFFIVSLAVSGATAMPIDTELRWLLPAVPTDTKASAWGYKVLHSYQAVRQYAPFLLYGYDWLAFAHFAFALLFIGPYKNPVKNIWVVQFGLIACVLIVPFALLAGAVRSIPFWWRLIDCSFGAGGFAVLYPCYRNIQRAAEKQAATFSNPHVHTQA